MKDLNYQLGIFAGEFVVATALPTLSTDMLHSNVVIEVSEELTKEWERRRELYSETILSGTYVGGDTNLFYENLKWYKENIEAKYLEDTLEITIPNCEPSDEKEFGEGFEAALWDCDLSHYRFHELGKFHKRSWGRKVILKRGEE